MGLKGDLSECGMVVGARRAIRKYPGGGSSWQKSFVEVIGHRKMAELFGADRKATGNVKK